MRADDLGVDAGEPLEVGVAEGVVQHGSAAFGGPCGTDRDVQQRDVLGVAAGHRVDRAELAHPVRRQQRPEAGDPGVPVGRVRGSQFVGGADPGHAGVGEDAVQEREVVVAGDAEDVGDAEVGEPVQQVVGHGGRGVVCHPYRLRSAGIPLPGFLRGTCAGPAESENSVAATLWNPQIRRSQPARQDAYRTCRGKQPIVAETRGKQSPRESGEGGERHDGCLPARPVPA